MVRDMTGKDVLQNGVIDGGEELTDIAFEHPTSAGVVVTSFISEGTESIERPMCTLPLPAREGIGNEPTGEEGIEDAINRMVQKAVTNRGLADVTGLGVGDAEVAVGAVGIGLTQKLAVQE